MDERTIVSVRTCDNPRTKKKREEKEKEATVAAGEETRATDMPHVRMDGRT